MRAIAMTETPTESIIAVNASYAAAHNIPTVNNTTNQVVAQFKALKGTHITVATSNTTSNAYDWLIDLGKKYGLTAGVNAPSDDINIFPAGGAAIADSALASGKVDAIAASPPDPPSPPTILIPYYKIPPANGTAGNYVLTTISMMQQHADVVQAVVTALAEAIELTIAHPQTAFNAVQASYGSVYGFTSSEDLTLFHAYADVANLVYPSKSGYDNEVFMVNEAQAAYGAQMTIPYSKFVVTKFAAAALKHLGLTYHPPTF
jgi:ABC-type nitrate/sulfonate/bicarbonate transport system substrate-binding protein